MPDSAIPEDTTTDSMPARFAGWLRTLSVPTWMSGGRLRPYAISLSVHLLLVLAMGSWVLPMLTQGTRTVAIEAVLAPKTDAAMTEFSQEMTVDAAANSATPVSTTAATAVPSTLPKEFSRPTESPVMPETVRARHSAENPLRSLSDEEMLQDLNLGVRAMAIHDHRGTTRVEEAESAVGIASTLEGDLLSIAEDGDAIVVWLLDQSLSMQQDIKVLAQGLLNTLEQIEADGDSRMQHAVVAFGDDVTLLLKPTVKGRLVANTIYKLPADPSGVERTFESVEWCINRLFPRRAGKERQKLLVLWTDESGDDYLRLENTIAMCVRANVRVDIIGPSAVLGAETGYTAYRHPANDQTYYLPVNRGPDSAFPQKLSLGYWYRGVPRTHDESFRGPFQGTSPRWHGGSNLQSMLSGFSPYALTRLSRETGGRYLMYDRPGDRAPFSLEEIKDYQPDYYSALEIQQRLQRQPLRQIVLASSGVTWSGGMLAQTQPDMAFGPGFGGQTHNEYVRSRLVPMLSREIRQAWADAMRIERALQPFLLASAMTGFEPDQQSSRFRRGRPQTKQRDKESTEESSSDDESVNEQRPNRNSAEELKKIAELEADEVQLDQLETELDESLLEQLYRQEESPRWRAWTDLNMGRLLAMSVRLREYLVVATGTLNHLQDLNADTNYVSFSQSRVLQGGPASGERLAVARRLLQRCIDQNRGTAWQVMAERELRDSFGLSVNQRFIPRPKNVPRGGPPTPPPPRPQLPNL
ncbi:MAG: VWA domain-containing protein [Planctomycetaceae bacterium]|nr:VWA domain-containing protein [Planctomycetaceae bacterium]